MNHKNIKAKTTRGFILRLSVCMLFFSISFTYVQATNLYSQHTQVSVEADKIDLVELFSKIENQTEFLFFYLDMDVQGIQVSVSAKNKKIEEVLTYALLGTQLDFKINDRNINIVRRVGAQSTQADSKPVRGAVRDSNGEAIIGASVVVKGTTIGTVTDINGNFELNALKDAKIIVSYLGYNSQELVIVGKSNLAIILTEDTQTLDEVIVIGYGTTKRQDFTGSVASVKMENSPVALAPNLNALEAIKGNVAGLDIGATSSAGGSPSMQIRGQKSISGSNAPLMVVDGVIFMGSINDINPNDIASFDVLKDATSAAAYGSRSANGVIIITTKKGKSGKPMVSLNATTSMQGWQNRPTVMKADQWIESVIARNGFDTNLDWLTAQEEENMKAGRETNWLDESTRTGFLQDYQIAVSGASEQVNYYLSAAYSGNKGVVVGDDYKRISILGKVNTEITSWLSFGLDASYTKMDYSGVGADLSAAMRVSPYGMKYRDEASGLLERFPATQSQANPLWGVDDAARKNMDIRNNFRLNAYARVKVPGVKGLSYSFSLSENLSKNQSGNFHHESFYIKEGAYNDPSRYSPASLQKLLASANGNIQNSTTTSWVIDNIVNYKNTFGKHSIDLTAVATRDRYTYESENATGSDYAANGNTTLGIYGLHKATTPKIDINYNQKSNIGYLGRISYSYDSKYFLTGSYRRDGSSVFGANNKWGDFAAAGIAWNLTEEDFMKDVSFLNNLKLKASWGRNGNQGLPAYGTLSTVINGSNSGIRYEWGNNSTIYYGLNANALGNMDLGWEQTESWNFGLETALLNSRIFIDVDGYFSKTTDQIFTRDIPVMTGFKTIKASMGQIDNRGLEITLRTVNITTKDLLWTTSFTYWLNRNKLAHLYGEDLNGDGKEDDDISNSRFIGHPLGVIYGYYQEGIVQTDDAQYIALTGSQPGYPKYKDLDGVDGISAADRKILGYTGANFKLNMSNTLTYKNWDLYAMITGTFGGGDYFMKSNAAAYMSNGSGAFNSNSVYVPWWTSENKSNTYTSATFSGDGRFQGLQNRGFVRIQDVSLAYSFRETWVKNAGIAKSKNVLFN